MKTLDQIPQHIIDSYPPEVREALALFSPEEAREIRIFFDQETGDFDCVGIVGPDNRVTKPADARKYQALLVIEDQVRRELAGVDYARRRLAEKFSDLLADNVPVRV